MRIKTRVVGFTIIGILFGLAIFSMILPTIIKADAQIYCADLFSNEEITATYSAAPFEVADFDNRGGVKLTSGKQGNKTRFVNVASGLFEIDFRALSSAYEVYDVTALRFIITDMNTQDFFAVEVGLTSDGLSAPTGKKLSETNSFDNVRAVVDTGSGKGYAYDSGISAITTYGTRLNSSYCSHYSKSVSISFNPATKEIYAYESGNTSKNLLLNLSDAKQLAATGRNIPFSSFATYSVDIEFTAMSDAAKSASIMVYSLFGYSFGNQQISYSKPVVYAKPEYKTRVNQEYALLDNVRVFDIVSGQIPFKGNIAVIDPQGTREELTEQNAVFTPTISGFYALEYTPVNASDVSGDTKTYYLEVVSIEDDYQLKTDNPISDMTIGRGTILNLPTAKVRDQFGGVVDSGRVSLSITREGSNTTILSSNLSNSIPYTFSKIGKYEVVWNAKDPYGKEVTSKTKITVDEAAPVFTGNRLNSSYAYGTILGLPEIEARVGSASTYPVNSIVMYPDGRQSGYDSVMLDAEGLYTVVHSATIDGTKYEFKEYFNTKYSSADLWKTKGVNTTANVDLPNYADAYGNGVKLTSTRNGGTATYKNSINLSNSNITVPIVDLMLTPEVYNTIEFKRFQIRLIDAHDKDNYITVSMAPVYWGYDNSSSFVCGANKDYVMAGVRGGTVHTVPEGATQIPTTMKGKYSGQYGVSRSIPFQVYFDANEKAVYVGSCANFAPLIVLDLDDPDHVGAGNEWEGFTTGEVFLELGFFNTVNSLCNLTVMGINGQSMSGEFLTEKNCVDVVVDGFDKDNTPDAIVSKKFSVFDAKLYNFISGKFLSINSVFVYRTDGGERIYYDIESGEFTPDVVGDYFIEYFGVDSNRNSARQTVLIKAYESLPDISYTLSSPPPVSANVGETIVLEEGIVSGGSGNVNVERYVAFGTRKDVLNGKSYTFKNSGKHVYTICLTDYLNREYLKQYEINVTVSEFPLITKSTMPSVIMSGRGTQFPEFKAVSYDADGVKTELPVDITVNGTKLEKDRMFKPENLNDLTVVYSAGNWVSENYIVKVKNSDTEIYLDRYFYYDNNVINVNESGYSLNFATDQLKANNGKAEFLFINTLPDFNIMLEFAVNKNNFDSINIYITDSLDSDIELKFSILKGATDKDKSIFKLNDGFDREMIGSFYSDNTPKPLVLKMTGNSIYDYDGTRIDTARMTQNNEVFKGFSSGEVRLRIEIEGITGESELCFRNLWGQPLGEIDDDYIGPIVKVGEFPSDVAYGDIVDLPQIILFDILSGKNIECRVSISDINGFVSDHYSGAQMNNLKIDLSVKYGFKVRTYGVHEIIFRVKDENGNTQIHTTSVVVAGEVDPILTINGTVKTAYKVNDKIEVPSASATDFMTNKLTVYAFLVDLAGRYDPVYVGKGDIAQFYEFEFKEAQTYTLLYYAYDEYGNYAMTQYTVTVK